MHIYIVIGLDHPAIMIEFDARFDMIMVGTSSAEVMADEVLQFGIADYELYASSHEHVLNITKGLTC